MAKEKYDIFLSYRRSEGKDIARAIKETLERRGYRVFLDMDELQDGVFDKRILDAIQSAPIFLILLTEHCLDRCDKESDWVRQEIDFALSHHKQIIPLNPDKQFSVFPANVPAHIHDGLCQHQYSTIDTGQLYQVSMDQLITRRLEPAFRRQKIRLGLWIALSIAILCVIGTAWYSYYRAHQPLVYYQQGCYYNQLGEPSYNRDSALLYFRQAADRGYAPAQRKLGELYQFSIDIPNHADLSYYWFKKAYLQGDTLATALLGYNYEYGIGIPVDIVEAVTLYKEGVDKQDPYAYYLLGLCLCHGKGLPADRAEGTRLIAQAAQMNDPWAKLYMQDAGIWIFNPHADSTSNQMVQIQAICLTDTATEIIACWTNNEYVGGWMNIHPAAYIEDAQTQERFTIVGIKGCAFYPQKTPVEWGCNNQFSMLFPALPHSVSHIHIIESDTSRWKWWNVFLGSK